METEDYLGIPGAIECGLVHEVDGLTPRCSPTWPDLSRQIVSNRSIVLPKRELTANYFAACRAAAHFPVVE